MVNFNQLQSCAYGWNFISSVCFYRRFSHVEEVAQYFTDICNLTFYNDFITDGHIHNDLLLLVVFYIALNTSDCPLIRAVNDTDVFTVAINYAESSCQFNILPFVLVSGFQGVAVQILGKLGYGICSILNCSLRRRTGNGCFGSGRTGGRTAGVRTARPSNRSKNNDYDNRDKPPTFVDRRFVFSTAMWSYFSTGSDFLPAMFTGCHFVLCHFNLPSLSF